MPIKGVFTPYDLERFKMAINYIERYYQNNYSAEHLAIEVGIDIKLLRAGIFAITGSTIHNYQLKVRIERALADLNDFKKSVKYIALKHGFSSASHFDKVFKRKTGQSPNQYRFQIIVNSEQHA